jgi:uncharacterized membrane-anchored protein
LKTFKDTTIHWVIAVFVAALQIGLAIFAVYSSHQDRLSDGACIVGGFGTLANLAILAVVSIWAIVLAVKSFRRAALHDRLKPLGIVVVSSATAVLIGMNAMLGCTV